MPRSPRYLSATEIAALAVCEQKVVLDVRQGERTTPAQREARRRGHVLHERFDQAVSAHHNRPVPTPSSGPCFVASVLYGKNDPRTDELRRFRDTRLAPHRAGRWVIHQYYRRSPSIADCLAKHPAWAAAARWSLDQLRRMLRHGGLTDVH